MAMPHDTQDQPTWQEHMVKELIAELQAIDDKARIEARFYEVMS
jgi:hypothetical protein